MTAFHPVSSRFGYPFFKSSNSLQILAGRAKRRELARLVKTRAQQTRDLRHQRLRREERIVLGRKLLHELLVLVQLLEVLHAAVRHADVLSLLAVRRVAEHADLHALAGHMRKLHSAGKTLVALRVVVLKTDLQF